MSNRNFDASSFTTLLQNRGPANYYNRQQTVQQAETQANISTQLAISPQTGNLDASNIINQNAGIPTAYYKNYPILTSNAPCTFVSK